MRFSVSSRQHCLSGRGRAAHNGRRAFRMCGPATWKAVPKQLRAVTVSSRSPNDRRRSFRQNFLSALDNIFLF